MNEILEEIKGLCFHSAEQLVKENHIPQRLASIIRKQPGYSTRYEMCITKSKNGEWRLYQRVDGQWEDASLHNILDDIARSDAAVALGRSRSPKKTEAARENAKKGGWKKGVPRKKKSDGSDAN